VFGQGRLVIRNEEGGGGGNTFLRVQNVNGASYGSNYLSFDLSNGTVAAPAPLWNWQILGGLLTTGQAGTDGQVFGVTEYFRAAEDWGPGHHGSAWELWSTPVGSVTQKKIFWIHGDEPYWPSLEGRPGGSGYFLCIDDSMEMYYSYAGCR
jgi:hypothetical protein